MSDRNGCGQSATHTPDELTRQLAFEHLVVACANRCMTEPLDDALQAGLATIGPFLHAHRAYIFQFSPTGGTCSSTHAWCASGVSPMCESRQRMRTADYPWWMAQLQADKVIAIDDVTNLPADAAAERAVLEAQQIRSLLVVPIPGDAGMIGFLGLDNCMLEMPYPDTDKALLRHMASLVSGAIRGNGRRRRQQAMDRRQAELLSELSATAESAVHGLSRSLAIREPYTAEHQERTADIARAIACELGVGTEDCRRIYYGALLHDIGKNCIPSEILCKPGALSEAEFGLMQCHPEYGADILQRIHFPWPIWRIAAAHHERLDGSGYPNGLRGDAIEMEVRIVSAADVLAAMTAHRPYRPAHPPERALAELHAWRGIRFDERVVDACDRLWRVGHLPLGYSQLQEQDRC